MFLRRKREQNKKKMSSLINARNSVFAEKTLAPEFIPWFNMKDVSLGIRTFDALRRLGDYHPPYSLD